MIIIDLQNKRVGIGMFEFRILQGILPQKALHPCGNLRITIPKFLLTVNLNGIARKARIGCPGTFAPWYLVLDFVSTVMYAPSAAVSDARSESAGDAGTSSRLSDNADEAAPLAPEGLVGSAESIAPLNIKIENTADLRYLEPTSRHHRNYGIEYIVGVLSDLSFL
jgi:hypothetical protein